MTLQEIAKSIHGLKESRFLGEALHVEVSLNGMPLICEVTVETLGFADQKETRVILTTEIQTTKEKIARLVATKNPFNDPWFEQNEARLSLHEEFISLTLPPQQTKALINPALERVFLLRESLR